MLAEFLKVFPASRSTQVKRLAVILTVRAPASLPVEGPRVANLPDTLWAAGQGLLDPVGALTQLPGLRFPTGLVGRRDGFLIVLTRILGMTRKQARQVAPADINVDANSKMITIGGTRMARAVRPGECPGAWLPAC